MGKPEFQLFGKKNCNGNQATNAIVGVKVAFGFIFSLFSCLIFTFAYLSNDKNNKIKLLFLFLNFA